MLRRSRAIAVSSIPRSAWDPARHDTRWADSYAKPMADRRAWPAKVYKIVPEPTTPTEWLTHSTRNMAYAYNAAIRACSTFPETIEYYREMKARGVEVDLDTAFTLISRGARYERMAPEDLFMLWDELTELGAKSDMSVVEVLHTVLDHSAVAQPQWREARRRQLIDAYNALAMEDIAKLGDGHGLDGLMLQQVRRYSRNVCALGGTLRYDVWAAAFSHINTWPTLVQEVCAMLAARSDGSKVPLVSHEIGPTMRFEAPDVRTLLRRHSDSDDAAQPWLKSALIVASGEAYGPRSYEDAAINGAFLAALERVVDANFFEHSKSGMDDRAVTQILLQIFFNSGVFMSSDVAAQAMDIIRFSADANRRDKAARGLMRRAQRGGNYAERTPELQAWLEEMRPVDARVIARYIMSVDPWSQVKFDSFAAKNGQTFASAGGADTSEALSGSNGPEDGEVRHQPQRSVHTAQDVDERMHSIQRVIERLAPLPAGSARSVPDRVVSDSSDSDSAKAARKEAIKAKHQDRQAAYRAPNGQQLITAQLVFLRHLVATQLNNPEVCQRAVFHLQLLKAEIDTLFATPSSPDIAAAPVSGDETPLSDGPETEAWESMLAVLKAIMDATVEGGVASQFGGKMSVERQKAASIAFAQASELRAKVVEESATRFHGKFRMLWLEEV